ncbi:MAG: energy transducer TonB [Novosphingobium sp.]|uniref:energy transducer TonB n=1 Tax=Novosphingobium sp. TaxID=1874826 RepID=UPI0032B8605C
MLRHVSTALVSLALVGAAPALAKPVPTDLARIGKWEVNYDKDSCRLFGKFGTDKNEIIAQFTRFEPSDSMELRLYGQSLKVDGQFFPVAFDFGPQENLQKRQALVGSSGKVPMVLFGRVRLDDWSQTKPSDVAPPMAPADEAKVTTLTVKAPTGKWYRLALGRMDTPMAALRRCTTDLVRSWGYDPSVMAALKSRPNPVGSPGKWVNFEDYPKTMLAKSANALIQFRLDVDAGGTVAGCSILSQAGETEFADTTCKLLSKRAKFVPALDAEGKPTRSYYISSVRWTVGA